MAPRRPAPRPDTLEAALARVFDDRNTSASWFALTGGEQLFAAGDDPDSLYLVRSGRLGVYRAQEGQPARFLGVIRPGEPVGEMALIAGTPHTASVVALRDTEIAGVRVPRGAVVTALLAGANRDPEVFEDPGTFDVARSNAADHVSFSSGRHFCLGAALARMEGEVGLRRLFDRFPNLRLQPGARRRDTRILRGFATLPATLS